MKYEHIMNNVVMLYGKVASMPIFSHETFGEGFYDMMISVPRLSDQKDNLPITISEKLMPKNLEIGTELKIKGQLRSYNKIVDGKSKLMLTVFVRELLENNDIQNPNSIEIVGFVCKPPIYRTTPFKREICDLLIAVNRAYNKSDYLPCIAWGRNARYAKDAVIGTKISLSGRIQSRGYQKRLEDGQTVDKVAYEISVNKLSILDNADKENVNYAE